MIFSGLEMMGDVPFSDVVIHSLVHAPSGGRMSKSLGTGMNPLALIDEHGADATRYGLMKMASSQDVTFSEGAIEEGRKLANKLWNASRLLIQAGVTEMDERPLVARGALDPRAAVGDAGRARGLPRPLRLLAPRRRALPPHLRRLLRLVPGGDQAAHLRRRRRRARDGRRGARAAAQAAAPGHAARDGGDLVEPAGTREPVDRCALARDRRRRPRPTRSSASRRRPSASGAAACRRRSRATRSGSSTRSSSPERRRPNGNVEVERGRLRKEIERAEKMLGNPGFTSKAPAEVVEAEREKLERYRRELDALGG